MHYEKNHTSEPKTTVKKTRQDKIKELSKLSNRESLCFHESGHTVMNILLHGEHEYQIQHRF